MNPASVLPADDAELAGADETIGELEIRLLMEAIYLRYQHDFRAYAPGLLRRRMAQARDQMGYEHLSELQHALLREPAVFARLLQYLTVQVSEMFRDPAYFRVLREEVMPQLSTWPSLKVWVAGCSHGEEVWSMAILLKEAGLLDRTILYATDINPQALQRAEAGVFPRDRAAQFSRNYLASGGTGSLSDYYTCAYDAIAFDRGLRRQIMFADHSLATDAVFSELHLVSCRNVLIYFTPALQDRSIGLFRDSLVRGGFLGLGSRETLQFGAHARAFEPIHVQADVKLYRRLPDAAPHDITPTTRRTTPPWNTR
ncbi:protein-glutamate O-methyltransferase CheR [Pelomonas sp. KK5]|uniref:CheR family methyltransferase n=1 Tax=Pelomonas sp. KK5 TaxID=1855730 RepID=UPI0009F9B78A|nr:CheR family methyltransferase [Pelomonas sp. KK5]